MYCDNHFVPLQALKRQVDDHEVWVQALEGKIRETTQDLRFFASALKELLAEERPPRKRRRCSHCTATAAGAASEASPRLASPEEACPQALWR